VGLLLAKLVLSTEHNSLVNLNQPDVFPREYVWFTVGTENISCATELQIRRTRRPTAHNYREEMASGCLLYTFIFCLCALDVQMSSAACTRQYSPPPDDDCASLEVPCFAYSEEGSGEPLPDVLEYPDNK